jgi:hypothetical protein
MSKKIKKFKTLYVYTLISKGQRAYYTCFQFVVEEIFLETCLFFYVGNFKKHFVLRVHL